MVISYDELADQFNERYRYQSFPGIQAWLRQLAAGPATPRLLEVGCGTGHWLNVLSDLPVELVGIDPSRPMLERSHARATRAQLVCAPAESMSFQAQCFDLIFCVNAFHHFSDPMKFLRDSRLLLKNTGRLAIFGLDPHAPGTGWYLYHYFPGVRNADLRRYLATTELKRLLVEAGYINVSSEPAQHIQKVFTGDEVFQDTFLVRESTSQLLLISEQAYREGRQAISAAVEKAQREQRSLAFRIDLTLFGTVAETSNSESTVQSKPIPEP